MKTKTRQDSGDAYSAFLAGMHFTENGQEAPLTGELDPPEDDLMTVNAGDEDETGPTGFNDGPTGPGLAGESGSVESPLVSAARKLTR